MKPEEHEELPNDSTPYCFNFLFPHLCSYLSLFLMLLLTSQSLHYSQKMLVMSESRLKIQITSGADIRTKDQDTPLTD